MTTQSPYVRLDQMTLAELRVVWQSLDTEEALEKWHTPFDAEHGISWDDWAENVKNRMEWLAKTPADGGFPFPASTECAQAYEAKLQETVDSTA